MVPINFTPYPWVEEDASLSFIAIELKLKSDQPPISDRTFQFFAY